MCITNLQGAIYLRNEFVYLVQIFIKKPHVSIILWRPSALKPICYVHQGEEEGRVPWAGWLLESDMNMNTFLLHQAKFIKIA